MKKTVILIGLALLLGLLVACGNTAAPKLEDGLNNQAVDPGSFELRGGNDVATLEWADIGGTTDTQSLEAVDEATLSFDILEVEAGNGNLFVKEDTGFSVAGPGDDATIQRFVEGDERITLRLADDVSERISGGIIGLSVPVGDGEQNITVRGFVDGAVVETATVTLSDLTEPTETSVPYPLQVAVDAIEFSQSGRNRFSLLASTFTTGDSGVEPGQTQLEGEPNSPATEAVPAIGYEPSPENYTQDYPGLSGILISYNTVILAFEIETTVQEANAILADYEAVIFGGLPGRTGDTQGLLIVEVPTTNHEELITLVEELNDRPEILVAVQDVILTTLAVSQANSGTPTGWAWENPPATGLGNTNWNLELIRAPQMWNLNAALEKQGESIGTGILDIGFSAHPDLIYAPPAAIAGQPLDHGTQVAGIIGATYNNRVGIDGVNPFTALYAQAYQFTPSAPSPFSLGSSWGQEMTQAIPRLYSSNEIQVIAISQGYNWGLNITNPSAQLIASRQGLTAAITFRSLWEGPLVAKEPIVAVAAGNDGATNAAQWASPFTNAAIEHGRDEIIVVESIDYSPTITLSSFSNSGGFIAAPGQSVTAPVSGNGYAAANGTSFATPHVAGLAGYMLNLDPSLTAQEIKNLLLANGVSIDGGARSYIDAFATVMAIDELRGNKNVLRRLLDIDDGTPDGNQRVVITAEGEATNADTDNDGVADNSLSLEKPLEYSITDFGSVTGSELVGEDVDNDGGVGDGIIDMADFRRWRDWYLQTSGQGNNLNGSATTYKKDVNSHPEAGITPVIDSNEDAYPRGDFNGDGSMANAAATSQVPGFGNTTDLQMLQRSGLWEDIFYTTDNLNSLLTSGDVEIWVRDLYTLDNVTGVRSYIIGDSSPNTRNHFSDFQRHVYTLAPGTYTALIQATDGAGNLVLELQKEFTVATGGDELWAPLASLTPDIISSYDGPLEDCPRLEGTFEYAFIGLFDGATPNIPILNGQTASMVVNQSLFNLLEQEKNSNEPLNVTAKTVRNCNLAEGPNQELGLVMEYTDPATNTGFYAYLYDTFENIDNRWPAFTWNRTDLTANETICPPLLTDVFTTGVDGRAAEPQTNLGIEPGSFGDVLMRSETLYQQEFRDEEGDLIVAAQFAPGFLDRKFTYNGVEQWVHTVGAYAQPACDGGIGSATAFNTQSLGDPFDGENSALFTPMENPEQEGELRKGRGF